MCPDYSKEEEDSRIEPDAIRRENWVLGSVFVASCALAGGVMWVTRSQPLLYIAIFCAVGFLIIWQRLRKRSITCNSPQGMYYDSLDAATRSTIARIESIADYIMFIAISLIFFLPAAQSQGENHITGIVNANGEYLLRGVLLYMRASSFYKIGIISLAWLINDLGISLLTRSERMQVYKEYRRLGTSLGSVKYILASLGVLMWILSANYNVRLAGKGIFVKRPYAIQETYYPWSSVDDAEGVSFGWWKIKFTNGSSVVADCVGYWQSGKDPVSFIKSHAGNP